MAKKFLFFPAREIEKIRSVLFEFPINQNKLSEILELLSEISKRDHLSAVKVLNRAKNEIGEVSDSYKRLEGLRKILFKKRFPCYQKKKEKFDAALKKLKLPRNIQVTPAPYFEDSFIKIQCDFSTEEEGNRVVEILTKREWNELLSTLD